ncbi:hypothetical protein [Staphylococcus aureus]|uniref:hypothetical protein n=1 Tax=Staphylococcus aureus TaxID=1280 RepID=UPI0024A9087B|nr:hypothetical protein [Staphylococcus aureus]
MITIIIAICSVILSICSFIVALLNRLDNLRPQIYAILNTKKDQEGKRIKAENLEIKNFGKVPGIITNIKIICEENIYINNKQYKFESMFEAPDNNYISLEKVLKLLCKNHILTPNQSLILSINQPAKSKKDDLEKLSNYNEVQKYSINTISEIDTRLSIKVYYQKSKKGLSFIKTYKDTSYLISK